jgi:hypothetical protein
MLRIKFKKFKTKKRKFLKKIKKMYISKDNLFFNYISKYTLNKYNKYSLSRYYLSKNLSNGKLLLQILKFRKFGVHQYFNNLIYIYNYNLNIKFNKKYNFINILNITSYLFKNGLKLIPLKIFNLIISDFYNIIHNENLSEVDLKNKEYLELDDVSQIDNFIENIKNDKNINFLLY